MHEQRVDCWQGGVVVKYSDLLKVIRYFTAHDEEGNDLKEHVDKVTKNAAIAKAVHLVAKGVVLSKDECDECIERERLMLAKRLEARDVKKGNKRNKKG